MAKLRATSVADPNEKHHEVVDALLESIPKEVHSLLPNPDKLRGMVKNIRYCSNSYKVSEKV